MPLDDKNLRMALNMAVDREKVIREGMLGYAPTSRASRRRGAQARRRTSSRSLDPARAKEMFSKVKWPQGRALKIATGGGFAGIAKLIAEDIEQNLGITVEIMIGEDSGALSGARALAEGKLIPAWDLLLTFWFDISSEATPAMIHREFFGSDGAFRVGPELPEFDHMYWDMAAQTEGPSLMKKEADLDRYTQHEALGLFLCSRSRSRP